jgi:transposase-like protein
MGKRPRRNHTPAFKAKVALAAIKGDRILALPAEQFDFHPNQITSWKAQLEGEVSMFRSRRRQWSEHIRYRREVACMHAFWRSDDVRADRPARCGIQSGSDRNAGRAPTETVLT